MFRENYRYFVLTLALVIFSFVPLFLGSGEMANVIASVSALLAMALFVIGFALSTYYHRHDIVNPIHRG